MLFKFNILSMKKIIFSLLIVISFSLFTSCEKDLSIDFTGNLKVVFSSASNIDFNEVSCYIFIADNNDIALKSSLHPNSKGVITIKNLNYGNYIFEYYYKDFCVDQLFQISAGKETAIEFDLPQ